MPYIYVGIANKVYVEELFRGYEVDVLSGPFHFLGTKTHYMQPCRMKKKDVKILGFSQGFEESHRVFIRLLQKLGSHKHPYGFHTGFYKNPRVFHKCS